MGLRFVILAVAAVARRPRRVEVAQRDGRQSVRRGVRLERALERELVSPYGLVGRSGCVSSIGTSSGSP